ncbi:MAG: phosphatase PAP2 family protein [Gemmatimonadota bacterium]
MIRLTPDGTVRAGSAPSHSLARPWLQPRAVCGSALLVMASLVTASPASAQADDASPVRWDDGPVLGLIAPGAPALERAAKSVLLLGSIVAFDPPFRDASLSVDSGTTDELAETAEWFGEWQASLPFIAGGAAAVGALTEGSHGLGRAGAVLGGVVASSMANEGLNVAIGRSRPLEGEGAFDFRPFTGHASFPSGHTAFVFSVAGGVDAVTEGWVPAAAAYGVATLTGLSRIYHDKHWLTDVAAGAAVGTFVSYRATRQLARWFGADRRAGSEVERGSVDGDRAADGRPAAAEADGMTLRLLATPGLVGLQIRF